ncbi:MAG: dienelactone hydrolase family protein [Acidobacteriota bacterium]|nr:dienelactone hydrolase family protein [Acidobacteriota bacterium]MDE3190660.1 dienelactone hydrolase family protein [Acidobacteriota bacterium]
MCFDSDSLPPVPAISGAAVSHDDLLLEAADGNRFAAFAAAPDEPAATGVVVLPDVRGLYRFYEELALRFAERGIAAVAFDYYGRTAGAEKRGEDFDYTPHREQTTPEGIQADVAACIAHLRDRGVTAVFTVGFCMGGRNAWLASAAAHGIAGAVGFYGRPPLDDVARLRGPILALQGGADAAIPVEDDEAFDEALTAAGIEHEVVIYDGAPHSFFDRKQEEFQADSDDAWRRTLDFIAGHA